jgi:hypothetical protein
MGAVMSQTREDARTPVWMLWTGRIVSALPVLIVLMSARMKLTSDPWYVQEWGRIGWQVGALPVIASLQLAAITLYVIPQTSMLGAVLLTGYMGGAIASYVRIGEFSPPMVPLTTAMLAWLGLFLREARLRQLLPLRWR